MADVLSTILEITQAERLATGFGFTEGPLWDPTNGCYYYVAVPGSSRLTARIWGSFARRRFLPI